MSTAMILKNLLSPAILYFFLGLLAVQAKSDLQLPAPVSKFLSLYLLLSIGFKGGAELAHSTIDQQTLLSLLGCVFMACIVPIYSFFILKKKLGPYDAGALAATYGSVSAVTFITACSFLTDLGVKFGGHMVAGLALMESPALIIGILLIRTYANDSEKESGGHGGIKEILHESFTNGSIVVLMGSVIIGFVTGGNGMNAVKPFIDDLFKGMLCFFLLDMGISAGQRIGDLRKAGITLAVFAILMPLFNAGLSLGIARLLDLPEGDAFLLIVLSASASYIAVPAALRMIVPQANPGLYVPMALALTFPFNIIVGLPVYYYLNHSFYTL